MRLNHNMYSLSIYKTYKGKIDDNAKALNNISSGNKLNSAKDNPNKIGENETLKIQVLTNDAASKNIQDANSMIQTFDGALQEVNNNLCRMKELTVSAGSGTLTADDRKIIQNEINSIKDDINDLTDRTEFNGTKLSDSSVPSVNGDPIKTIKSAIGNMDDESMDIPLFNVGAKNLGLANVDVRDVYEYAYGGNADSIDHDVYACHEANVGVDVNTFSKPDIDGSLDAVDKAIQMVSKVRSKYGSIQKRLEGTADYLSSKDISIQTAQSKIGDADIAEEMMNFSKSQLFVNASIGLMAQSNNFPKDALNILANVK